MDMRFKIVAAAVAMLLVSSVTSAAAAHVFGDVSDDDMHAEAIAWAAANGITLGCDEAGNFCPDDPVTRAQVAQFLYRLSGGDPEVAPVVDAATVGGQTPDDLQGDVGPRGPIGSPGPAGPQGAPGPEHVGHAYADEDGNLPVNVENFRLELSCVEGKANVVVGTVDNQPFEYVWIVDGSVVRDIDGRDFVQTWDFDANGAFKVFGRTVSGAVFLVDGYASADGVSDCDVAGTLSVRPPAA